MWLFDTDFTDLQIKLEIILRHQPKVIAFGMAGQDCPDWTGLSGLDLNVRTGPDCPDWTGLSGLDWTVRTGPDWTGLDRTGQDCPDWTGLSGLDRTVRTVFTFKSQIYRFQISESLLPFH